MWTLVSQSTKALRPIKVNLIKTSVYGAREMSQWLRLLTVLLEDLGSFPSTHMAAYRHL